MVSMAREQRRLASKEICDTGSWQRDYEDAAGIVDVHFVNWSMSCEVKDRERKVTRLSFGISIQFSLVGAFTSFLVRYSALQ